MSSWIYSVDSHVGRVRSNNEDSYIANGRAGYWIVADGMGGHAAGDIASQIACQACSDALSQGADVVRAIQIAHQAVLAGIRQGLGSGNMGTTIVVARLQGQQLDIGWIGDSRAYLYNGFHLRQLTRDHSFVQQLVDLGTITAAEAQRHPERNVIMQSLGSSAERQLDIGHIVHTLNRNERLLLCSDGLNGEISDNTISTLLRKNITPEAAVSALIDASLAAGGKDNVTCAVIQAADCSQPPIRHWFSTQLQNLQSLFKNEQ